MTYLKVINNPHYCTFIAIHCLVGYAVAIWVYSKPQSVTRCLASHSQNSQAALMVPTVSLTIPQIVLFHHAQEQHMVHTCPVDFQQLIHHFPVN